ncbi:DUF397 domain-containing protein [Streptomyces sp. RY43-2]|uniref:DUF397 domain-containing protein n=1 Tax=Streptomyces macrolidinus TaxID=2952607 RepID=A0ABT0Z775_9ACTN|nr:DUF397 domain-containing protein [Streptomyces macrolidinus]MCN9239619.1 DUF397 domain-containing protein [Streptomyces macrolidinus]
MNTRQSTGLQRHLSWRKSRYSGSGGGNCVEIAEAAGEVAVRDSKNVKGGVVRLGPEAWAHFLPYAADRCPVR